VFLVGSVPNLFHKNRVDWHRNRSEG
jgi:hypothetical protein